MPGESNGGPKARPKEKSKVEWKVNLKVKLKERPRHSFAYWRRDSVPLTRPGRAESVKQNWQQKNKRKNKQKMPPTFPRYSTRQEKTRLLREMGPDGRRYPLFTLN